MFRKFLLQQTENVVCNQTSMDIVYANCSSFNKLTQTFIVQL